MHVSFKTISGPATGIYREKGSKFLAFAYPAGDESAIKKHLETLRKEYFDARHHCFAWVLGPGRDNVRAYDDGEPNHSAGDPILGQIRSRELTNVLVVVVRYFGGTKLGVGGLVHAYKTAAADALNQADIVEREITGSLTVTYDYASSAEVMKLVADFNLKILAQTFDESCSLTASFAIRHQDMLRSRVELLHTLNQLKTFRMDTP